MFPCLINTLIINVVYQFFLSFYSTTPAWVCFLKILLSHDIEKNPGDFINGFFNFCNWNVNSLSKDNFHRLQLLEAHNSIFNYDLISLCETSLNDSVELPDSLLDDYTFVSSNCPNNSRHGGVGLLYKNSLPLKIRDDIGFDETIVVELKFGRKKIFFTVLYRSPAHTNSTPEFEMFLTNLKNLHTSIKDEDPYAMFFTGDFNGHSQQWWPGGDSTLEGNSIEDLTTMLGLTQLINEPTNFEPNKNPSCIDLVFTDQPNLVLESGTHTFLDPYCHHQITHCRFNFKIPPPPPFERNIWLYDKSNVNLIRRCISNFPWEQHLSSNPDPNWQVESFTEIILNIMSNFVPNKIIKVVPSDPPWISRSLKNMLNKQNRLFRNFKRHGYKLDDKNRVDNFRKECEMAINKSKEDYLKNLGDKLINPNTSQKSYWKMVNRVMNKCKAPKIPPI